MGKKGDDGIENSLKFLALCLYVDGDFVKCGWSRRTEPHGGQTHGRAIPTSPWKAGCSQYCLPHPCGGAVPCRPNNLPAPCSCEDRAARCPAQTRNRGPANGSLDAEETSIRAM